MARPSTAPPSWATNPGTRDPAGAIPSGRQGTGWVPGEAIAAKGLNAPLGQWADWLVHLATLNPTAEVLQATELRIVSAVGGTDLGALGKDGTDIELSSLNTITINSGADLIVVADTIELNATVVIEAAASLHALDGVIATAPASGPIYAFDVVESVPIDMSPGNSGWNYIALTSGGTTYPSMAVSAAGVDFVDLIGESSLVGGDCAWRRPLTEIEGNARTGTIWTVQSLSCEFNQDASVAFTWTLKRRHRTTGVISTATKTSGGADIEVVVGTATTSPATMTSINTDLDLSTYSYFMQIVATDNRLSAKRLREFAIVLDKHGSD